MKDHAGTTVSQSSFAHKADRVLFWLFAALFFSLPIGTSPSVITGILALAVWVLSGKVVTERQRFMHEPWFWPLIVFILLPWIGLLWTPDLEEGLSLASKTYYYLLAFTLATVRLSEEDAMFLLKAFLVGLAVAAICSLLQLVTILPIKSGIPSLIDAKRIHGAAFLTLGMTLLALLAFPWRTTVLRIGMVFLIVIFVLIIGMGGAKSGYLGLVVIAPFLLYRFYPRLNMLKTALLIMLIFCLLLVFGPFRERMSEVQPEIQGYAQGNPNTGVGIRLHMWKGAIEIVRNHPVAGTGTGGYKAAMKQFEDASLAPLFHNISNPHNSYLYVASSFGVIGLVSLLWFLYVVLKKGWCARQSLAGFAVFAWGVLMVLLGFSSTPILDFATANLLALMTGIRVSDYDA